MSESCEYRAIRSNFGKLVDGVTPSVKMFATMAVSEELIPLWLMDTGAMDVVKAVLHRTSSDPNPQKPFQDLVKILRSDASTEHLAKSLMTSLEESRKAPVRDAGPQIVVSPETTRRRFSAQKIFVSPVPRTLSEMDSGFSSFSELSQTEELGTADPMLRYLATPAPVSQPTLTKQQTTEKYLKTEKHATAVHRTFLYPSEVTQISSSTPKKPNSPRSYMAMLSDQCRAIGSPCSSIGSPCPTFDSLESSISSLSSPSVTVVGGEYYPRSPAALETGFVGEEKSSVSSVSEDQYQHQIAKLCEQLQHVQQKWEEEKQIGYEIFKKNFILKKLIRCMKREQKKLEMRLQESHATASKLEKVSKEQKVDLEILQRNVHLVEGLLSEVRSTCSSLEKKLSNTQTELEMCKGNERKWKKQSSELAMKLKMAVMDACQHRQENETLRNRIDILEKLIDQFRELEVQSNELEEVRKRVHKSCYF